MVLDRSAAYCDYYKRQQGGDIPIFRGGQHGAGLGDILRGILRFIAPIALRGISTFAGATMAARDKGASLPDAARSAIAPALGVMASQFQNSAQQVGQGDTLFDGEQGVPYKKHVTFDPNVDEHVYKSKLKRKAAKQKGSSTIKKQPKLNF
jgi:transposase-like protein